MRLTALAGLMAACSGAELDSDAGEAPSGGTGGGGRATAGDAGGGTGGGGRATAGEAGGGTGGGGGTTVGDAGGGTGGSGGTTVGEAGGGTGGSGGTTVGEAGDGTAPADAGEAGAAGFGGGAPLFECTEGEYQGNVRLDKQGEVALLQGFSRVEGDLEIAGTVANLSALRCLSEIGGDLRFEYTEALRSLAGLEQLVMVQGDVVLTGDGCDEACKSNPKPASVAGLDGLVTIGGNLTYSERCSWAEPEDFCRDGPALGVFDGFHSLVHVGGSLVINLTKSLTTVRGFERLERVGSLWVINNEHLTSFAGAPRLSDAGEVHIFRNYQLAELGTFPRLETLASFELADHHLENLDAFASLKFAETLLLHGSLFDSSLVDASALDGIEVTERLEVQDTALANLDVFHRVETLSELYIFENELLTDLRGLSSLESVGRVAIMGNPSLASCEAQWLIDNIENITDYAQNEGNGSGTCP
jgi:hypothetical protein